MGNVSASEDAKRYRDGYPGKEDDPRIKTNLEFYQNKRASKPEGDTIENIHKKWFGKHGLLEAHHGYIQWLFPIREDGMNHYAEQLQLHEAKAIASDPVLQGRVITSYELMLEFYGIKLTDRKTGSLERNSNWKERYQHLNRSFHNYLRITRILKCLGEMGLEHFKLPFVKFLLKEVYENRELQNCRESLVRYWTPVLRKDAELKEAMELIEKYEGSTRGNSNSNRNVQSEISDDSESEEEEEVEATSKSNNKSPAASEKSSNSNSNSDTNANPAATSSASSPSVDVSSDSSATANEENTKTTGENSNEETKKEDPKPKEDL